MGWDEMRWIGREGEYEPVIFCCFEALLIYFGYSLGRDVPLFLPYAYYSLNILST